MHQSYGYIKVTLIAVMIALISFLHYGAFGAHLGLHIIHRELYFIPIILACLWFGSVIGISTAAVVSLIYFPHIYLFEDAHGTLAAVATQIAVFLAVAVSIGYLIDRQRRKQAEVMALENLQVLARAAGVVEHEITATLNVLRKAFDDPASGGASAEAEDYRKEIDRLARMADALRAFAPKTETSPVGTHDLNAAIRDQVAKLNPLAKKHHLFLRVELDPNACPSKIHPERFGPMLGDLIQNAVEASDAGQTIRIQSRRGGDSCTVTVADEGRGIRPEHLAKIFSPFFTTKPNGQGLALAATRKYLRSMGGDITVQSEPGRGAEFTLALPREDAEMVIQRIGQ